MKVREFLRIVLTAVAESTLDLQKANTCVCLRACGLGGFRLRGFRA